jgi:hypothetical protein
VPFGEQYFISPTSSSLQISWNDNSSNEDGFRLERASTADGPWTLSATTPPNTILWGWGSAREEQICFRVIAFTTAGATAPSSADCTTPPANPTNLVAKAADGQSIALTWTDNSAVEDGYRVSRLASGGWIDIATLAANSVSYRDAGLTADLTYTYRVRALKDGGSSDFSNEADGVISATRPTAPLNAFASYWLDIEYGWLYLDVSWTDESNNEEGFRIESSIDGVSGWQTHAVLAANVTSHQDQLSLWDGLTSQSGCYRVVAFNGAGESIPSNVTCTEWYNPPTNLTATPVDQQSIELKWTDNAHFEKGYVVFRSTTAYGAYYSVGETPANATSYRDTGLASGQEYWYFVSSDYGGYSFYDVYNYSDRVSATTLSAMGPMQLSRTIITTPLTTIRVSGRPTLKDLRARYRLQTSAELGSAGVTPTRVKRPALRQTPPVSGRKGY